MVECLEKKTALLSPQALAPKWQAVWLNKGHGRSQGGRTLRCDKPQKMLDNLPSSLSFASFVKET